MTATPKPAMEPNDPALRNYCELLEASGASDFEIKRAVMFASWFGFDAFPTGCAVFDTPTCGNPICYNPRHQQFVQLPEAVSS